MNNLVAGLLLVLVALTLILSSFSFVLLGKDRKPTDGLSTATRFFLVALRLAIGWHFFIEGLDKFHNPGWSSEAYLRESSGPLAPAFRGMAGDRLIDKLTVGADKSFPAELDVEWQAYLDAFVDFYDLDEEQRTRVVTAFDQVKQNLGETWLFSQKRMVNKSTSHPGGDTIEVPMTMPERLKEHEELEAKVTAITDIELPELGPRVFDKLAIAKSNLNKWRSSMQRDVGLMGKELKRTLQGVVLGIVEEGIPRPERDTIEKARVAVRAEADKEKPDPQRWEEIDRAKDKWGDKVLAAYRRAFADLERRDKDAAARWDDLTTRVYANIIERRHKDVDPYDPLPYRVGRPLSRWSLLDYSDVIVKYGVTVVGLCLLAGLFTRTFCVVGAVYLFLFFLAMPPLPGWPASPRAEGHYLFINKNIIEMLALLTLATTHSGRWVGLDGLIGVFRRAIWKPREPSDMLEWPQKNGQPATSATPQSVTANEPRAFE